MRVLVITGDGEMLMGLGSLATIEVKQPRNLTILVLDNRSGAEAALSTIQNIAIAKTRPCGTAD